MFKLNLQNLVKGVQLSGFNLPKQIAINPQNPAQFFVADSSHVYLADWTSPSSPTFTSLFAVSGMNTALPVSSSLLAIYGGNLFDLGSLQSYSSSDSVFLGIGWIPLSMISLNGYATVTGSGYAINCVDSPFGGNIEIIINHPGARQQGATHYAIWLAGTWISSSFGDYKSVLNPQTQTNQFVYTLTTPTTFDNSGRFFYPLRSPFDLWLNPFFGGQIDTFIAPNGLNYLYVEFYNINQGTSPATINWITYGYTPLMIDNVYPQASINQIYHVVNNQLVPVQSCAIVTGTSTLFEFNISAIDPDNHLLSYNLYSIWGMNKEGSIASDSYSNYLGGAPLWSGVNNYDTPSPPWNAYYPGDNSSTFCSHSYILNVQDRAINGYNFIHWTQFTEFITLMLS